MMDFLLTVGIFILYAWLAFGVLAIVIAPFVLLMRWLVWKGWL